MEKAIDKIIDKLKRMHGEPRVELRYTNPIELVIATILSAQCTDERVNRVTEDLFKRYKGLDDYIKVPQEILERDIRPTGFYRNKAKAIKTVAKELLERFEGRVPHDIDEFAKIPGIGRKSANMIIGLIYNRPAIIVDTHVLRVAQRIGLAKGKDPKRIEAELKEVVPEVNWLTFSLLTILHGRYICKARRPECERCLLIDECDYASGGKG